MCSVNATENYHPKTKVEVLADEMSHSTFYQGLYYLLRQNDLWRKKYNFHLETFTYDPSIYTTDHPKFIVSNQKEESISV